jgi:GMP synthase-like glutamine amidotransferase
MRALVIQHAEDAPSGLVGAWLTEHGADQDVYPIGADGRQPDPLEYELVVSLGSECSAYDDTLPWVGREQRLLRDAVDGDVPVLGICFGSQILARALGGEALRAQQSEIGWVAVRTRAPALIVEGPWFQWHYDTFTPPAEAVVLADSPAGPQAYTVGRSLGVQFHPEVTNEIVEEWVSLGRDQLARDAVDGERLLVETRKRAAENRARAWRLMDAFVDRVAGIDLSG